MSLTGGGMATIVEVAERAGVGVGTGSRVLDNMRTVRPMTHDSVLQPLQDHLFCPDQQACRLVMTWTYRVGVVLPYLTRPASVLHRIEMTAATNGYHHQTFNVESEAKQRDYLRDMPYRHSTTSLCEQHKQRSQDPGRSN